MNSNHLQLIIGDKNYCYEVIVRSMVKQVFWQRIRNGAEVDYMPIATKPQIQTMLCKFALIVWYFKCYCCY
jgi:hypothetical protein